METSEKVIRVLAEELEINGGRLIHPTRLAVSGTIAGPGLFELLAHIGRETVVVRLRRAAEYVRMKDKKDIV